MFIAFLITLIVLLSVLLSLMVGLNFTNVKRCQRQYENSQFWYGKFMEEKEAYKALEQGRDEESDSYEQQFLTFNEILGNQSTAIDSYIEDLHFLVGLVGNHYEHCLPNLADVADRERFEAIKAGVLLQEG